MRDDMLVNTGRTKLALLPLAWLQSPGFAVISCWRLARHLDGGGPLRRLLAALIWRYGVARHGCHISLKAEIGPRLRLPHATAIVIGDGVVIGSDVTIYQSVTLGRADEIAADYPRIESGAVIYAGAVILGGVSIGERARVGANSVVLCDVAAETTAAGIPARPIGA